MTWWMSPGCLGGCDEGPYLGQITWPCPPADCGWSLSPYAPRPAFHPGIPHPYAPPIVAGKDDCCGSCAQGSACETACKERKAHVGALYVSDAELDALGSQIALMDGDVKAAAQKEYDSSDLAKQKAECIKAGFEWDETGHRCKNLPSWLGGTPAIGMPVTGPLSKFSSEEWGPFDLKWTEYRSQTFHEPTSYDVLRTQFTSLRDKWVGPLAQQTRATVPPPLADTSGTNAIPWGWITLGGAILILPFVLPSLAALYLVATRGKMMGLA